MKQTIEIEVPEGKKAVWKNNQIVFVDVEPHWKSIKTFEDAYDYCYNNFSEYTTNYNTIATNTYEKLISGLKLVIVALTNNEKLSLIKGNLYFPIIQFCNNNKESISKCLGNKIIGKIKIEGKEYLVVGGSAHYGCRMGIGSVYYDDSYSTNYCNISLSCVSSREIAEHLSTYFGKLIFEVMFRGSNCDWKWIE